MANIVVVLMGAPGIVIGAGGLYFALRRLEQHRRVSKCAIIGFSCLLLSSLMFLALRIWIRYAATGDIEPSSVGRVITYWNLAAYPINVIGLAVISVSVFMDRQPRGGIPDQANVSEKAHWPSAQIDI